MTKRDNNAVEFVEGEISKLDEQLCSVLAQKCMEGIRKMYGNCMEIYGRCRGDVWKIYGKIDGECMGNI